MTTLVIVESPGKVKKISALLGAGYKVAASVGHVRDLPRKETGIAPPNFQLAYEPTERGRDVLARLKKEVAQAESVILATDPDREGEAIAWHLADALNLKNPRRVTFSAITKAAIEAAIAAPRDIDMALVRAQEARRALDRIVGYRVSPELSNMAGQALSAGRVQSPAVRLVVDRERAIAAFKVTEHYGAELVFANEDGTKWKAAWDVKPHLQAGDEYLMDDELAKRVAEIRAVTVTSFKDSEKGRAPAAPFTTSTLQQVAGKKLKYKPKKTMELAQRLYEQGAITYHRTDAPNMDAAGQEDIANYAKSVGLVLAEKPRKWKAKDGAQEGHEAIRPTHTADLEAGENDEEKALYKLIWQRAVASQLADAIYAVRSVTLAGDAQGLAVKFNASGRTVTSPGWMAVYSDDTEEDEEAAASNPIPALSDGDGLTAESGRMLTKKTKPPARFTEPTLVAEMERMGIGRPSTYAAILENISGRSYVTTDAKGYLIPSEIGASVRDALVGRFKFAELDYTRGLEEQLDMIAEAKADYLPVVSAAWAALDDELEQLSTANIPVAHPCPACGKALSRRKGQYGFFWSCTGWPECDTKLPDNKGKPGERKAPPPPSDIPCPKCGKDLARRKGQYGFFWSCTGWPECDTKLPDNEGKPGERKAPPPPSDIPCPKCGKDLARRQGVSKPKTKGQKGRPYDFYGCTGFPKCDATYQTGEDGKPNLT